MNEIDDMNDYMDKWKIKLIFTDLINSIMTARPENPLTYSM